MIVSEGQFRKVNRDLYRMGVAAMDDAINDVEAILVLKSDGSVRAILPESREVEEREYDGKEPEHRVKTELTYYAMNSGSIVINGRIIYWR